MATYIEREAVEKFIENGLNNPNEAKRFGHDAIEIMAEVHYMPAADVAPVVHSYWEGYSCSQYMGTDEVGEPKWRDGRFYVCHNYKCRRKTVIKSNYCPNCGAKMGGGDNDAAD